MKVLAILLLSSLTIAMALALPVDLGADVPAGDQQAVALADLADLGAEDPAADQTTNTIRRPRFLLSKLFKPQTVVVQPVIVQRPVQPYGVYQQSYPYYPRRF
ncbi:uncharacterized protein LOC108094805 [Drosophila ficusphila]|uniref:uncharacterized protein LOC108094805 n=1 Tax=Drosophila ficusphila TaxID=30025 RepID=UPI0007E73E60|nr:uncharacterized protein LOC108094805 [Drosophila ficusphila]